MTIVLGYRRDGRPIFPIKGGAPYDFPFTVPDDVTALSEEDLTALNEQVRAHAGELLESDEAPPEGLIETQHLMERVQGEQTRRESAASARQSLSSALSEPEGNEGNEGGEGDPPDDGGEPGSGGAVTATSRPPKLAQINPGAPETPPGAGERDTSVTMRAASDVPGFASGSEFGDFNQAATAVQNRLEGYGSGHAPARNLSNAEVRVPGSRNRIRLSQNPIRHGAVQFKRNYPDELRITDTVNPLKVIDHASNERRLPGKSLAKSAQQQVDEGKAITAAVGWCAPSETIYDLCELESMDGILDLPEVQASRGGFQLPSDGGPDFGSIWDNVGSEGDVILSEYDVQEDTTKQCLEITCPDFEDVRLDVAYMCLTGSLLQRRGYPEVVERFSRGAMVALAHKINESVISRMVTASDGPTTIPQDTGGDDAAAALLSAVELAIVDIKYRNRMSFNTTVEIVLPMWVLQPLRAAFSRRKGIGALNISDSEIMAWFSTRNAAPRFVYDWQDTFSGQASGPGGDSALTEMPSEVDFLAYPAGTWTKAVRDVVNLDTIYDSNLLATNQYTAVFAEEGFNVMQTCPDTRQYRVGVDPSGIVGCCASEFS